MSLFSNTARCIGHNHFNPTITSMWRLLTEYTILFYSFTKLIGNMNTMIYSIVTLAYKQSTFCQACFHFQLTETASVC